MSDPWDRTDGDRGEWPARDLDAGGSAQSPADRWSSGDLWPNPDRQDGSGWGEWPTTPVEPEDYVLDEPAPMLSDPWAESWTDESAGATAVPTDEPPRRHVVAEPDPSFAYPDLPPRTEEGVTWPAAVDEVLTADGASTTPDPAPAVDAWAAPEASPTSTTRPWAEEGDPWPSRSSDAVPDQQGAVREAPQSAETEVDSPPELSLGDSGADAADANDWPAAEAPPRDPGPAIEWPSAADREPLPDWLAEPIPPMRPSPELMPPRPGSIERTASSDDEPQSPEQPDAAQATLGESADGGTDAGIVVDEPSDEDEAASESRPWWRSVASWTAAARGSGASTPDIADEPDAGADDSSTDDAEATRPRTDEDGAPEGAIADADVAEPEVAAEDADASADPVHAPDFDVEAEPAIIVEPVGLPEPEPHVAAQLEPALAPDADEEPGADAGSVDVEAEPVPAPEAEPGLSRPAWASATAVEREPEVAAEPEVAGEPDADVAGEPEPEVAAEPAHDGGAASEEAAGVAEEPWQPRASTWPEQPDWTRPSRPDAVPSESTQVLPTSWAPPPASVPSAEIDTGAPAAAAQARNDALEPVAGDIRTRLREPDADLDDDAEANPSTAEQAVPWLIGFILLLAGMVIVLLALIFAGDESLGSDGSNPSPSAFAGVPAGASTADPSATEVATHTALPSPSPSPGPSTAATATAAPTPTPVPAPQYGPLELVYQGRSTALAPIYLLRRDFTVEEEPEVLAQDATLDVRHFAWAPDGTVGVGLYADVLVSIEPGEEKRRLGDELAAVTFGADAGTVYAVRVTEDGGEDVATVMAIDFDSGDATELASVSYARPQIEAEAALAEAQFQDDGGAIRLYWMDEELVRLWVLGAGGWEITADGDVTEIDDARPMLWAPDGDARIQITPDGSASTLTVVDPDGEAQAATTVTGRVSHVRWAPNGGRIVFTLGRSASGGGVLQDLFLWDLGDGEAPTQITSTGAAFGAEWRGSRPLWTP